ncbi:MAG: c-type cytochrome [Anaerolineaceae bacterium]|nr:c-type cytochrome [Anaerolineaceae bacterium]
MSALSKPNSQPVSFLIPSILTVSLLTILLVFMITQVRPPNSNHVVVVALDPVAVKAGKTTFMTVCAACHSPKATGIKGLGKPLIGSAFFNGHTDEELLAFLKKGRPVNDPLNTTGVTMPARGGRLSLTDTDLANVISYIRSLNQK